jgi:hypothetical protein
MKLHVAKTMANAIEAMSDAAFQQAGSALLKAKDTVREVAQERTTSEIKKIISKLQSNERVSSEETALVRTWIVGDAVAYTDMENNFQDWLSEYERLHNSLAAYEDTDCSYEELLKVHGLLEDATRVSLDIANFLEKKERIKKFESAVDDGIDKDEGDILGEILIGKLQSPKY